MVHTLSSEEVKCPSTSEKKEEDTADKHSLSQIVQINIEWINHVGSVYPRYDAMKTALCLCGLPPINL